MWPSGNHPFSRYHFNVSANPVEKSIFGRQPGSSLQRGLTTQFLWYNSPSLPGENTPGVPLSHPRISEHQAGSINIERGRNTTRVFCPVMAEATAAIPAKSYPPV